MVGKILPLFLCSLMGAQTAHAAGDFNSVADRVERELRTLSVKLVSTPNPAQLSGAATAVNVRVEAQVNEAARARVNALVAELREAARGLGGARSLTDVRVVQECRWSVNRMAWGPTTAARVQEIPAVAGRTVMPFSKVGAASVVADIEWRLEPIRADATSQATPIWVPWTGAKARVVAARAMSSVSVVRAPSAPLLPVEAPEVNLVVAGPAAALLGETVEMVATAKGLNRSGTLLLPQTKIVWSSGGRVLGEGGRLAFGVPAAGAYDVVAMLVKQDRESRAVLHVARHTLTVREKSVPAVDAALEQEREDAKREAELRAKWAKIEEQKRLEDEAAQRLAEEQRRADEAKKQAEEQLARQKAEADAAEAAAAKERERAELAAAKERELAEAAAAAEERAKQAQLEAEKRKAEEAQRLAEEQRRADEAKKRAEEELARQKAEQEAAAAAAELRAQQAEAEAQEKIAAQQRKLAADGAALEERGSLAGAIAKYEAALAVAPDDALTARIAALKKQLADQAEQQKREDDARRFAKEAKAFERQGDFAGAILAFEEAQKLLPSDDFAAQVDRLQKLQAEQVEERQREEAGRRLVAEGEAKEAAGDLQGAVTSYESSLALVSDASIKRRISNLNKKLAAAEEEKRIQAEQQQRAEEQRRAEQARKQEQEKYAREKAEAEAAEAAAAAKAKAESEAAVAAALQARQVEQAEREQRQTEANKLAEEGKALEMNGDLGGAIAKYEEATTIAPDPALGKRIKRLQKQQADLDEQARRDEEAQKLAGEGEALEQAGDLSGAAAKYEASIKVVPDAVLKKRIAALKKQIAGLEDQALREEADRKQAEAERVKEEARLAAEAKAREEERLLAEERARKEAEAAAAAEREKEAARVAAEAKAKAESEKAAEQLAAEQAAVVAETKPEPNLEVVAPSAAPAEPAVQAAAVVPAIDYELSLAGPVLEGKKPKLWDAQKHALVDVTDRLAVYQDIGFSVSVEPEPKAKPLRYEWSIEPAGCSANTIHERSIRIRASEGGTYTLGVTVRDANDVVLGAASFALAITISREELDRALASQEADAKVARAKGLAGKGRLDEALGLAAEALRLDPASKEAATLSGKWSSDRKLVQEQIALARAWMAKRNYDQASAAWRKAQGLQPQYAPVRELADELKALKATVDRAQGLVNEGYVQEQRENLAGAVAKYEAAMKLVPDAKLAERIDQLKKSMAESEAQRLINDGYEHEKKGDIDAAVARYEKAMTVLPDDRIAARIKALKSSVPAP